MRGRCRWSRSKSARYRLRPSRRAFWSSWGASLPWWERNERTVESLFGECSVATPVSTRSHSTSTSSLMLRTLRIQRCDFVDLAQKWLLDSPGSSPTGAHLSAILQPRPLCLS